MSKLILPNYEGKQIKWLVSFFYKDFTITLCKIEAEKIVYGGIAFELLKHIEGEPDIKEGTKFNTSKLHNTENEAGRELKRFVDVYRKGSNRLLKKDLTLN